MNILILTNHISDFAGSEILSLELYEYFKSKNNIVKIFANYVNEPIKNYFDNNDIIKSIDDIDIAMFDLVWSQHCIFSRLFKNIKHDLIKLKIISVHLSPITQFEIASVRHMNRLNILFVANSEETKDKLIELGVTNNKIVVNYNAAPKKFINNFRVNSLKNILIVTNHPPQELLEAKEILSKKYNVVCIGWNNKVLVTPEEIIKYDVIVTIGKTVQYSLLSSIPVYCYDLYGGPGYLNNENYNIAKYHNFSGRGFTRKSCKEIIFEIENNFINACDYMKSFKSKDDFNLDIVMNKIINKCEVNLLNRQDQLDISVSCFYEEIISIYYNISENLSNEKKDILEERNNLFEERNNLFEERNNLFEERNNLFEERNNFINKSKKYKRQRNILSLVTIIFIIYSVVLTFKTLL